MVIDINGYDPGKGTTLAEWIINSKTPRGWKGQGVGIAFERDFILGVRNESKGESDGACLF